MKRLILALIITLALSGYSYARTCEQGFTCPGAEWTCEKIFQTFTSRTAFQDWLISHAVNEYTVVYATSTRIDIVWDENCYPKPVDCKDVQGDCVP